MVADLPQVFTTVIGDGENHRFTVEHGLNRHDTLVTVYDKDSGTECLVNLEKHAEHVVIDTGYYLGLSTYHRVGPFKLPRRKAKLVVHPGSIPAPDSLKVVVIG
jgi:hypothetical protein